MLSDKCFQEWTKNAQVSNILWINGHPGSGKSVLASFVIKHLLDSTRKCEYFFFKHDDSTKRCASSLIRSLALQIAHDIPAFGDAIHKMNESGLRLEKHDAKSIWQKLFVSTLFNLEHGPICWVIDALDESDSMHAVIEMLSNVSSSKTSIHVIILSRQTPGISMALDRISSMLPLTTMSLDYNTDDIRLHAMSELAYMHGTAELRQKIVEKIVRKSQGSFLWANLVLQKIVECHSYNEIKIAMEEIPSGMDSLYQRMEAAIKELPKESEKSLARAILHWATYSRRPLKIDEFATALRPEFSEILDLTFTIKKTCGHFAIVDRNHCVSLVHQTARDFLIKKSSLPFSLSPLEAHNKLCKRNLSMYLDGQVRSQLAKTPLPHFYSYSATSWGHHLNLSSTASDDIFDMLISFFQGSYVLSWIQALAVLGQLKVLISTSQILTSFIHRRRKIDAAKMPLLHRLSDLQLLEVWAVDLLKIVGKFGSHLLQEPTIIYNYIAQFSPSNSAIFQQFNRSTQASISVSGLSNADWDDCLARVSVGSDHLALQLTSSARNLAVLSSDGTIHLWNSLTFEKLANIFQQEHIFSMCFSKDGDKLATYGSLSTCVWAIPMGHQLVKVANPPNSRALCMVFANKDSTLIMGSSLRDIRKLHLNKPECGWLSTKISTSSKETTPKGAFSNAPTAMAFDHGMDKVAIAYRGSPMTVWALEEPKCISKCKRSLANGRNESTKWMGVNRVVWHPFSGEILGIHTDGVVFKWHPLEEKHQELQTDLSLTPSEIQCSQDGLVFATSDVNGTIRLYNHEHFAILYQLSSEDVITALCFSADTRRLFDLRGSYCNVWEPNALIRMPNIDEDAETEEGSTTISRQVSEAWTESRSSITALAARSQRLVFCTGNDDGVVQLCSTNDNKRQIVGRSATGMGIDHLVWAEDGATLAYAEQEGTL